MARGDETIAASYLGALSGWQRAELARVNGPGWLLLREILADGQGLAFLGAGVSAPHYPLWAQVISALIDAAADRLTEDEARTCRGLAMGNPDAVVEIVRDRMGEGAYREALRRLFTPRKDPVTQFTWTPAHELVARCNFAGVITTNYDPGMVNARMAVRTHASATGFASWDDEDLLVRWRQGTVFDGDDPLPVLFAHGHHNRPESIVLATTEYRRAYRGMLGEVLDRLLDTRRVVWIGFSFADQRIQAILREIENRSTTTVTTRPAARHVAILAWDPASHQTPDTVRAVLEISQGCRVVLYPAPGGDHRALGLLLAELTDPRYPPAHAKPPVPLPGPNRDDEGLVQRWVHGTEHATHFTGRIEELTRLGRWARDQEVRLIGVTAWGGAGKTALVSEWLAGHHGARHRPAVRGVFAWGFYQRNSVQEWAEELLSWVGDTFGVSPRPGPLATRVLSVLRAVPLVVVLDGLEVLQEAPGGEQFGRLLNGALRTVLTGVCQHDQAGLIVLTSRFPFADLVQFDGGSARMMDVPPFTAAEGIRVLVQAGGGWLPRAERLELVRAVDGHALAVNALAGALTARPPTGDLQNLRTELLEAGRTDSQVGKVLRFYADRLSTGDRALVAIVGLFQRPVPVGTVLAVGAHATVGAPLQGWSPAQVETAARQRLPGLVSWHPGGTLSAHPLVRDAFRPLVLSGDTARLAASTALGDLPGGRVATRDEALRVVEMIELLLDADRWHDADWLYRDRIGDDFLRNLPAAQLEQRAAVAFVGTPVRRRACRVRLGHRRFSYYLNDVGLMGMLAGNPAAANYLHAAAAEDRSQGDTTNLSNVLQTLTALAIHLGDTEMGAHTAARAFDATTADDRVRIKHSYVGLGQVNDLVGATRAADEHYLAADLIEYADDPDGDHLYSVPGTLWAAQLARTGRTPAARRLTVRNREVCTRYKWYADRARCDRELGRCDLIEGDLDSAGVRLLAAVDVLRDGDYLVEWAATLPDLAEHRRRIGALEEAERLCTEAVAAAGPRGLVPTHSRALATRALVRGDHFARTAYGNHLDRARDDVLAAERLATRTRRLPWQELDALRAHAHLDRLAGQDHGWRLRVEKLHTELVPPGLDPDPPSTVEARVAASSRTGGKRGRPGT